MSVEFDSSTYSTLEVNVQTFFIDKFKRFNGNTIAFDGENILTKIIFVFILKKILKIFERKINFISCIYWSRIVAENQFDLVPICQ